MAQFFEEPLTTGLVIAGVILVAVLVLVLITRFVLSKTRIGRRATARSQAALEEARDAIAELGAELAALDAEVAVTGADTDDNPPNRMRGRKMRAAHIRDDAYDEYRGLRDGGLLPVLVRRTARALTAKLHEAIASIATLRTEHVAWSQLNRTRDALIDARQAEQGDVADRIGQLQALIDELDPVVDGDEAATLRSLVTDAQEEQRIVIERLAAAETAEGSQLLHVLADAATHETRAAERARLAEEWHRLNVQALGALEQERTTALTAVTSAEHFMSTVSSDERRLEAAVTFCRTVLAEADTHKQRYPLVTIDEFAGIHERIDRALEAGRTPQQELFAARTALPVTLAAARNAVTEAEITVGLGSAVDARCDLDAARGQLALARRASDPLAAVEHARAARHEAFRAQQAARLAQGNTGEEELAVAN